MSRPRPRNYRRRTTRPTSRTLNQATRWRGPGASAPTQGAAKRRRGPDGARAAPSIERGEPKTRCRFAIKTRWVFHTPPPHGGGTPSFDHGGGGLTPGAGGLVEGGNVDLGAGLYKRHTPAENIQNPDCKFM